MSSKWLWFLSFSIVICCQTANGTWETNEGVMDLTIAICKEPENKERPPDRLIQMLSAIVRNMEISENKTRVTIYEIGGQNQFVRVIDNSFDKGDIIKAINDIGTYVKLRHNPTYHEAAKGIRDRVNAKATGRIDVPKPIMIIWEDQQKSAEEITVKDAADSNGASFVFLSTFRPCDGCQLEMLFVFPSIQEFEQFEESSLDGVAKFIADMIRDMVKKCQFKRSTSSCYIDTGSQCVANVLYETIFNDGKEGRPPSKQLEWCFFKNGSTIPCSPDDCPTTKTRPTLNTTATKEKGSTSTSSIKKTTSKRSTKTKNGSASTISKSALENVAHKKPDEADSSMTRLMIGVGITCFLVVLAIIALAIFLVVRRKKRVALREKKMEEIRKKFDAAKKRSQYKIAKKRSQFKIAKKKPQRKIAKTKSQFKVAKMESKSAVAETESKELPCETPASEPEWSYSQPPSLSVTPIDELMKKYYSKKKGVQKNCDPNDDMP